MNFELPPNNPIFKKKGLVVVVTSVESLLLLKVSTSFLSLLIENLTGYPYFWTILYNTLFFMRFS